MEYLSKPVSGCLTSLEQDRVDHALDEICIWDGPWLTYSDIHPSSDLELCSDLSFDLYGPQEWRHERAEIMAEYAEQARNDISGNINRDTQKYKTIRTFIRDREDREKFSDTIITDLYLFPTGRYTWDTMNKKEKTWTLIGENK